LFFIIINNIGLIVLVGGYGRGGRYGWFFATGYQKKEAATA
jgi:hypothetical protein